MVKASVEVLLTQAAHNLLVLYSTRQQTEENLPDLASAVFPVILNPGVINGFASGILLRWILSLVHIVAQNCV